MSGDNQRQGIPGGAEELSQKQQSALAALQKGANFIDAAEAAGVNRVTLYRWVKLDASFRAAYNAWEQEKCEVARARLMMASGNAVERLIKNLDIDPKLAFKVLKELGVFRQRSAGSINPEQVRQEIELELKPPQPSGNARAKRLAGAVSEPAESPQLALMSAVLKELDRASQPVQRPAPSRDPAEISVGSCPDDSELEDDDEEM